MQKLTYVRSNHIKIREYMRFRLQLYWDNSTEKNLQNLVQKRPNLMYKQQQSKQLQQKRENAAGAASHKRCNTIHSYGTHSRRRN